MRLCCILEIRSFRLRMSCNSMYHDLRCVVRDRLQIVVYIVLWAISICIGEVNECQSVKRLRRCDFIATHGLNFLPSFNFLTLSLSFSNCALISANSSLFFSLLWNL